MKYFLKVNINSVPSLANRHQHWAKTAKERKRWHELIAHAFRIHKPKTPLELCVVRVVRFSSRMPDYDNLVYSFKPVVDGLKNAGIIKNDDMLTIIDRKYSWCKVPEKMRHITVEVEEIERT